MTKARDLIHNCDFDEYIEDALVQWQVPGLSLSIIHNHEILITKGYGVREINKDDPIDEYSIFAIGSTTKAFTTAALAMLVDEGKLRWDDPVIKHLLEFQLSDPWVTKNVTVCDLLTHRCGLARHDALWIVASHDRNEILRRLPSHETKPRLPFTPQIPEHHVPCSGANHSSSNGEKLGRFHTGTDHSSASNDLYQHKHRLAFR